MIIWILYQEGESSGKQMEIEDGEMEEKKR